MSQSNESYWTRWKRGWKYGQPQLMITPLWFFIVIQSSRDVDSYLYFLGASLLLLIASFAFLPYALANAPTPMRLAEETIERFAVAIDRCVVAAKLQNELKPLYEIHRLAESGKSDAVRAYKDWKNVTWDEALVAIEKWRETIALEKLEFMRRYLLDHHAMPNSEATVA